MKLLLLGGTQFVGRAVAESALERGHQLTLFHRGRTNPELFPTAKHLHGDRDGDLAALEGRRFDAVIDTSGYVPRVVRASAELLADSADHYVFVSSISVYSDFSTGPDEDSAVQHWDGATEDVNAAYGAMKVSCEDAVREAFAGRALIVRPGLIVGPHDPTFRYTYWVDRLARGGDVVAPEPKEHPVQVIDVRDLAAWLVASAEARLTGTFNAVGPAQRLTMEDLLERTRAATGGDARLHWIPVDVLLENGVEEFVTLPLWLADPAWGGHGEVANVRAVAAGLSFRPLERTAADTLAWIHSGAAMYVDQGRPKPGLDPRAEAGLIEAVAA